MMPQPKPLEREALEAGLRAILIKHAGGMQFSVSPVAMAELADFVAEREKAMIEDTRKWVAYNKHDMGELGEFIRTQYVYNKLDELEDQTDA